MLQSFTYHELHCLKPAPLREGPQLLLVPENPPHWEKLKVILYKYLSRIKI